MVVSLHSTVTSVCGVQQERKVFFRPMCGYFPHHSQKAGTLVWSLLLKHKIIHTSKNSEKVYFLFFNLILRNESLFGGKQS